MTGYFTPALIITMALLIAALAVQTKRAENAVAEGAALKSEFLDLEVALRKTRETLDFALSVNSANAQARDEAMARGEMAMKALAELSAKHQQAMADLERAKITDETDTECRHLDQPLSGDFVSWLRE